MAGFFLLLYTGYAITIFFINRPLHIIIASIPVIFFYLFIPKTLLKKGLLITLLFGASIFIANLLSPSGDIIFKKGPFIIAEDSLRLGFVRAMRLVILVMAAKALLWRFPAERILNDLRKISGPVGKNKMINEFIESSLLTLKALPGVKRELEKLYRQHCKDGNILERARSIVMIISLVLGKAIQRPEDFF
ncbi:MAG: energy-coupling factor transporter transmembrane component T [Thermodesulfovibrionales bacterium]